MGAWDTLAEALGVGSKSFQELKGWLNECVPVFVFQRMICGRAVKVCSVITPDFVSESQKRGFEAYVYRIPGHVFAVVNTSDGPVQVDLSWIQFDVPKLAAKISDEHDSDSDPWGEIRAVDELLKKVARNPFSAIKVQRVDHVDENRLEPASHSDGEYDRTKRLVDKIMSDRSKSSNELMKIFMTEPTPLSK